MTEEQLATISADQFWRTQDVDGLEADYGYSELENGISSSTRRETSNYQLHFLYRLNALIVNAREEHLKKCNAKDQAQCPYNIYYFKAERLIQQRIRQINPNYDRQSLNTELVNKTLMQFKDFPNAIKPFEEALTLFNQGGSDRNIVDNIRLALEIFLKEKLKNNVSIEKQSNALGTLLKQSGTSSEIMNMFIKLVDGYMKYQNENVKHADKLKRDEVELMINLTLSFINFIVHK